MDLMKARDGLIGFLREFEHNETNSRPADSHDFEYSSKQVQYQVYMEYLSGLCKLMCERYNREYVRGSRTLKQDAETAGNGE